VTVGVTTVVAVTFGGAAAVNVAVAAASVAVWVMAARVAVCVGTAVGRSVGLAGAGVAVGVCRVGVTVAGNDVAAIALVVTVGRAVEVGRTAVAEAVGGGAQPVGAAPPCEPPEASGITRPATKASPMTTIVSTTMEDR
jgi:hypothetical protein